MVHRRTVALPEAHLRAHPRPDRGRLANTRHHVFTHLYGSLREYCNLFGQHDRRVDNRQPGMSPHGDCVLGRPAAIASVEARFNLTLGFSTTGMASLPQAADINIQERTSTTA